MPKETDHQSHVILAGPGTILSTGTNEDSDFQVLIQFLQLQILGTSADGKYWKVKTAQPINGLEGTFFLS